MRDDRAKHKQVQYRSQAESEAFSITLHISYKSVNSAEGI